MTTDELLGIMDMQDPPFAAWPVFLETPQAAEITEDERRALKSIAWPGEPSVASYMMGLAALRSVS